MPNPAVDKNLPHVTIQMPVYKESLELTMLVLLLYTICADTDCAALLLFTRSRKPCKPTLVKVAPQPFSSVMTVFSCSAKKTAKLGFHFMRIIILDGWHAHHIHLRRMGTNVLGDLRKPLSMYLICRMLSRADLISLLLVIGSMNYGLGKSLRFPRGIL
jgi:hypothetical protein